MKLLKDKDTKQDDGNGQHPANRVQRLLYLAQLRFHASPYHEMINGALRLLDLSTAAPAVRHGGFSTNAKLSPSPRSVSKSRFAKNELVCWERGPING